MIKHFKRAFDSLDEIHEFVLEFAGQNGLEEKMVYIIDLVVEELFTNAVKFNPGNTKDITIDLSKDSQKLLVSLIDYDVEPFDIRQAKEYDPKKPLRDRRVGGLGIPLVKRLSDKIEYEYEDRQSKVTFIKYMENHHVRHSH